MINAMSVDVEEWFQVGAFEKVIAARDWPQLESRVEGNCAQVLDLFAKHGVKATFFALGWIAARCPRLIRRIVDDGHEVASHGWDHRRVFTMTPNHFALDLTRARAALEDASGARVIGYRAPSFSIDARTPWAHGILAEQGYAYSSSVAPVLHDHYGWPQSPRFAWTPPDAGGLIELPVTTARAAGRTWAAGGGGFFRVLPYAFTHKAIRQANEKAGAPAIFYFHPWEVDPDQPRVKQAPLRARMRHYSRINAMAGKLERLIGDFAWGRVDQVARHEYARLQRGEQQGEDLMQ